MRITLLKNNDGSANVLTGINGNVSVIMGVDLVEITRDSEGTNFLMHRGSEIAGYILTETRNAPIAQGLLHDLKAAAITTVNL